MRKMSKPASTYNVTVLSRTEIETYPKLGEKELRVHTTYVAAGLAPKTIFMPKDEWTAEKEKAAIRKDIEARLKEKPEAFMV